MRHFCFLLVFAIVSLSALAQPAATRASWNWPALLRAGAPAREVQWLRDSLPPTESQRLFELLAALAQPEEAQLLPALFYLDGSATRPGVRAWLDSLTKRPPAGPAGPVRVAYLTGRLRAQLKLPEISSIQWPPAEAVAAAPVAPPAGFGIAFDLSPATTFLQVLRTPNADAKTIDAQLQGPFYAALIKHRNQTFYEVPVTREALVRCLERAASTRPLDQLYRYVNPRGLLGFADVQNHRPQYEQLVSGLAQREAECVAYVQTQLGPYLPTGLRMKQPVAFSLVSGAGGWQTGRVMAVELRSSRGNLAKFLPVLAHETFHGVQEAANPEDTTKVAKNPRHAFVKVLDYMYREGTANFVSTPSATQSNYAKQVAEGARLLDEVRRACFVGFDPARVQELEDQGVAGDGPFYALGEEMSRTIVAQLGRPALARTIRAGAPAFCRSYLAAVRQSKKPNLLSSELVGVLTRL